MREKLETFKERKIAVIGDLVADQFLYGTIARVSREAPVFILRHDETETRAGGAANAAVNAAALEASVYAIGLVGGDAAGGGLVDFMKSSGVDCSGVVISADVETTTKTRVLAGQHYAARQQVIRIDHENRKGISEELHRKLRQNLADVQETVDCIVLSDYGYGVVNAALFDAAAAAAKATNIPLIVDSRYSLETFAGATAATPNQEEVEQILGENFTNGNCEGLLTTLGMEALVVTRGNKGMTVFEKGKEAVEIDAVGPKEPVDVTGAGDTVIAVFALGLASGLSYSDAARIANCAGGVVVMKKGTATATADEIMALASDAGLAKVSATK